MWVGVTAAAHTASKNTRHHDDNFPNNMRCFGLKVTEDITNLKAFTPQNMPHIHVKEVNF